MERYGPFKVISLCRCVAILTPLHFSSRVCDTLLLFHPAYRNSLTLSPPSLSRLPFFLPGVLKAVGHINDTLGPALIASVGVELAAFSFLPCWQVMCWQSLETSYSNTRLSLFSNHLLLISTAYKKIFCKDTGRNKQANPYCTR